MISLICFVVHPCLLDESWFFIFMLSPVVSLVVYHFLICFLILLYLLLLYLFNQSEAHVLLLCRSLVTCAGICLSYTTFNTSKQHSFLYICIRFSFIQLLKSCSRDIIAINQMDRLYMLYLS